MRRSLMSVFATGLLQIIVLSSCQSDRNSVCTTDYRPGIEVSVVDSVDGSDLRPRAFGVARRGAIVDTLRETGNSLAGAYEAPGDYSIEIVVPGFQPWRLEHVALQSDECHVITQFITARMHRL